MLIQYILQFIYIQHVYSMCMCYSLVPRLPLACMTFELALEFKGRAIIALKARNEATCTCCTVMCILTSGM